jgi:DNA-binding transcriptional MocR family regulator
LPVEAMARASQAALDGFGSTMLEYGVNAGPPLLLNWLRKRLVELEGGEVASDQIIVTAGNSHALDLLITLFTQPGDVVLVESPTYHLAIRVLRDHPVELVTAPADEDGIDVERLAALVQQLNREGKRVRALYIVPTFNNPTGLSLSDERRRQLVELAATEGILILEDDVYRELAYDAPAPPSLWQMAPEGAVARMGSFSKTLAPGLRLGFLTASRQIVARIVDCGLLDSGGGVNHFTACCVAALCEIGDYTLQVERLRATYRSRRDALLGALQERLPGEYRWPTPAGCFFVWLRLPAGMDSSRLLDVACANGVAFVPGRRFYLDGNGASHMRLAFTLYTEDQLADAAQKLGQAIRLLTPCP